MSQWLDWQMIQSLAANRPPATITALSSEGAVFLQACSAFYDSRYRWLYGSNDVTNEQWNGIQKMVSDVELALMSPLVGMILPNVLASITGLALLDCDGTSYDKADYPLLYDALANAYIIDANTFRVPDLRDVFMRGASGTNPIGTTGGEDEHTLTESEMPAHSHTNSPHTHTEITALANVTTIGAGAPQATAIPSVGVTGASSIFIDSTGGGQAHNNIPAFESISFVIVAG